MEKTMHIAEFKAQFSQVGEWVSQGIVIKIIKGRSGEVIGYFSKTGSEKTKPDIIPCIWKDEAFEIKNDFELTEEEINSWEN